MSRGNWEEREAWRGALVGLTRGTPTATMLAPLKTTTSGSRAFLVAANDRQQYWVKVPGNPQGEIMMATEVIVAAVGNIIGAPVRPTTLLRIPQALVGWKYGPTDWVRPGTAHASLHLAGTEESNQTGDLAYVKRDHNSTRQPAILALWDLCMGGDAQWLYDQTREHSVWSFDHGLWLGGDPDWSGDILEPIVGMDWRWIGPVAGMSAEAFLEMSVRVSAITVGEVMTAVAAVPVDWKIQEWDLETVAWLVYNRRLGVSNRLVEFAMSL